ncbi:interferon-inducible double-stranded RNA-dependent protein kinase activator A homolog [Condylostylus longicornis]|uniref:interferon-inducible double-stranded RNA-dependent protein kinase activator A homolog n=1 Tax=Condylostylus longicornis TaxID=2530218 RepID=UPI00244DAA20|nr:interferon-inducible double-stranded RNA-dependent protein kinase activator A homolog [Condylostylus longicornis]
MANVMNIDDPRLNCDKKIDELHFNEISLEEAIKDDDKSTRIETSEVFENISKVEPNEYVNQSNSICLGQNFTFFKNLFTLHDFADIQNKNSISLLQELLIRHKIVPKYELVYCKGPEHCPKFCYRISFSNIKNYIEEFGYGYTKKEAKYSAANSLINKIFLSIKNTENKRPVEYEIKEAKINSGPHKRTMNEKLDKNDNLSNMSENYENDINTNDNKIISFEENLKNFALMCRKEIELKNHHGNPIGLLQEMCVAKRFLLPNYEIVEEKGLPHCKEFTVVCILGKYRVTGFGYRKKDAKHNAAFNMIQRLKEISESVKGVIDKIK